MAEAKHPALAVFFILSLVPTGFAQQAAKKAEDPALAEVNRVVWEGRQEIQAFRQRGGQNSDPNHPALKWSQRLWEMRARYQRSEAASVAASAALQMLVRSDRVATAIEWADTLAPDDPAWEQVFPVLLDAASRQNDYSHVISRLKALLEHPDSEKLRPGLYFYLGLAYKRTGEDRAAKTAFESVIRLVPGSAWAKAAQAGIEEVTVLGIGQPAPAVQARARDGQAISLADFKGKAVLVILWAST